MIFLGIIQLIAQYSRLLHLKDQKFEGILKGFRALVRIITFLVGAFLISWWKGIDPKMFIDGILMKEYTYKVYDEVGYYELQGDPWIPFKVVLIHVVSSLCVYSCG